MAIGVLTRRDGYNYGTSLQAYAIVKAIEQLGYTAEVIDFCEYSRKFIAWKSLLNCLGRLRISNFDETMLQRNAFDLFDKRLPLNSKKYRGSIPKQAFANKYDKIVCGSDQIWNPLQLKRAFLLDFIDKDTPKIAYAPSLGMSDCEQMFSHEDISLIRRFDLLSCREENGAKVISAITTQPCETVCDPTLLLKADDYTKIEHPLSITQPFILTYFLGESDNIPTEFIKREASERNLEIINIPLYYSPELPNVKNLRVGPSEFLWLIRNATVVCTNSYHGTIFSLIFNKLFYLFKRGYTIKNYSENSRFATLFKFIGKEFPQLYVSAANAPYDSINYDDINRHWELAKKQSLTYLMKALQCTK